MGDMREAFEPYKEMHRQRVAKNPDRLEYAIQMLEDNAIFYKVCNTQTAQINAILDDGNILTFYAGTGKIKGHDRIRGIHAFVNLCNKKNRQIRTHNKNKEEENND